MKNTFTRITTTGALLCAVACGSQKTGPTLNAKATLKAPKVNALTAAQVLGHDVCATFTLQPYQFSSAGVPANAGGTLTFSTSESTDGQSGGPVLINPANGASAPQEVLGCASDGPSVTSGTNTYNWGYFVTAQDFTTCVPGEGGSASDPTSLASALAAIQPVIVNAPIDCTTSTDESLSITIPISIPLTLQSGYIDVSANVDVTEEYVGCKIADSSEGNGLHFGQTYSAPTASAPSSIGTLTYISNNGSGTVDTDYASLGAGWVSQFSGSFTDSTTNSTEFYTTGIAPADTSLVYQSFISSGQAACLAQMSGQPGNTNTYEFQSPWWFATKSPECIHNSASSPADTADLADATVFFDDSFWGHFFATATLRSGPGGQYVDVLSGADQPTNIFDATTTDTQIGGSTSSASLVNPTIGEYKISVPSGYTANGVYPNLTGYGLPGFDASFWVVAVDNATGGLVFTGVDSNGLGATWQPIPDAADSACLGLFATGNSCSAPPVYGAGNGGDFCNIPIGSTSSVWAP